MKKKTFIIMMLIIVLGALTGLNISEFGILDGIIGTVLAVIVGTVFILVFNKIVSKLED